MGEGALALHRQATVADVQAHPSLKVSLFQRSLESRGAPPRWMLSWRVGMRRRSPSCIPLKAPIAFKGLRPVST